MCGRLALSLKLSVIQNSCKYLALDSNQVVKPEFLRLDNLGKKYDPSFNVPPISVLPVLVSRMHFDEMADSSEVVLVEMLWGLIPRWHRGDYRKHGYYGTNNSRIENLMTSKMYLPAFKRGQRCVALCEGFYEWQNTDRRLRNLKRPVYYLYHQQTKKEKSEDAAKHVNLVKIAGIFDVWYNSRGDNLYSFTIITQEAGKSTGWLHSRIPAILENEDQVFDWLDYERLPFKSALKLIKKPKNLIWHEVSKYVNNTRNKSNKCIQPIADEKKSVDIKSPIKRINLKLSLKRKASEELKNERKKRFKK